MTKSEYTILRFSHNRTFDKNRFKLASTKDHTINLLSWALDEYFLTVHSSRYLPGVLVQTEVEQEEVLLILDDYPLNEATPCDDSVLKQAGLTTPPTFSVQQNFSSSYRSIHAYIFTSLENPGLALYNLQRKSTCELLRIPPNTKPSETLNG